MSGRDSLTDALQMHGILWLLSFLSAEPLFPAWAGKLEEGSRTLQTLRGNSTLSEKELAAFESIEPLVLISIRQFEEARAVLRTLRSKPAPSIESSRYLDSLEKILSDWEAGVEARQMPDP